jgi:hypothetical protein
MNVERFLCRPAGQHQQLVGIDAPMVRQQDAHRHVWAITGADTADGLVSILIILYPISSMYMRRLNKKLPRIIIEGA